MDKTNEIREIANIARINSGLDIGESDCVRIAEAVIKAGYTRQSKFKEAVQEYDFKSMSEQLSDRGFDRMEISGILSIVDNARKDKETELVALDEHECGDKIMKVIINNWDGGAVNPAELYAKIMRVISKFGTPVKEAGLQPLDEVEVLKVIRNFTRPSGRISIEDSLISEAICSKFGQPPERELPNEDDVFEQMFKEAELRGISISRGHCKILACAILRLLKEKKG